MISHLISSPTAVSYGSTTREIRYDEYPHSEGRAKRSELCPGVDRSYFRGSGWTGTLHIVAAKLLDLNSTMSVACLSRGLKK